MSSHNNSMETDQHKLRKWIGVASFLIGSVLLLLCIGYFSLSNFSRSQLIRLEYQISETRIDNPTNTGISPEYWTNPRWADTAYIQANPNLGIMRGFVPIDPDTLPKSIGSAPIPTKLSIPSIGLNSQIKELEVVNINDANAWETPKHIAGHIPTTSRPGERGILYLFGHLHSPVKGEGSVFRDLIKIPGLLENGREIHVLVENQHKVSFLYEINNSKVIHEDSFTLEKSDDSMLTLVACVPKYVYDHRLMVSGKLIAIKQ